MRFYQKIEFLPNTSALSTSPLLRRLAHPRCQSVKWMTWRNQAWHLRTQCKSVG